MTGETGYARVQGEMNLDWEIALLRDEVWRKKVATGDVIVVRYADDRVPRAQRAERALQ